MIQFIVQYWVQWLLGLVATGLAIVAKYFHSLYKKNKANVEEKQIQQLHQDMDDKILASQQQFINQMTQTQMELKQSIADLKISTDQIGKDRYEYLAGLLTEYEQDSMQSYKEMYDSLGQQLQKLRQDSDTQDISMKSDLDMVHKKMNILTTGVLSIQGRDFKENCRQLLQQDHTITEIEYEEISSDHDIYNGLGGNHRGDDLFNLVQEKYKKNL